ncbi:MAG TPA: polysaccharide deacetylase family protein [Acidimicrobiales bacterium]|nr:polysaccharide deacetylase family protein [Acidimicrobiales bacterium]
MSLAGARHLRRRPGAVLEVVVAALAVTAASGAVLLRVSGRPDTISVIVVAGGTPRIAKVAKAATVADALEEVEVAPRPGRLLSLGTAKVLDPALRPVTLTVNGLLVGLDAPLLAGATIEVVEPPDQTEGVVEAEIDVPAPPMPDVIKALWHPGRPGRALSRAGAVSDEVVSLDQLVAPLPPTPVTERMVALTFDDGPWAGTSEFLRILREKDVKATFCVVTRQLKGAGLDLAKAALAEGHRLCNHTVDHDQSLPGKSQKTVDEEIIGANNHLQDRLGIKPAYYRPPGGKLGPKVIATAKAQGQQVLMWTVDTKDFTKPPPEAIVGSVLGQVKPGGVVLMHDGGGDRSATLAALPEVIDRLRADGYEFVLPDEVAPVPKAPA